VAVPKIVTDHLKHGAIPGLSAGASESYAASETCRILTLPKRMKKLQSSNLTQFILRRRIFFYCTVFHHLLRVHLAPNGTGAGGF
jgi:hypothetical protein